VLSLGIDGSSLVLPHQPVATASLSHNGPSSEDSPRVNNQHPNPTTFPRTNTANSPCPHAIHFQLPPATNIRRVTNTFYDLDIVSSLGNCGLALARHCSL